MFGTNAFGESAFADAATIVPVTGTSVGGSNAFSSTPIVTAGQVFGAAIVAGVGKQKGVVAAAGKAAGNALVQGLTFLTGHALASRNQLFDFSVDVMQALLWQYDTADVLPDLIKAKQRWYTDNQQNFWERWFIDVFDLRTANDFGCSVWAIILGIPLNIIYGESDGANWGFGPYQENFERGNFSPLTYVTLPLTVEQKRLVCQLRYYQLITRGQVPDINKNLARIFGPFGPAWVINNKDMTMTYVFDFDMPSPLAFILKFYSLLPAPTGVDVNWVRKGQAVGKARGAAVVNGVT